jgi:cellulose biosynthesis protein BcsQ
MDIELAEAFSAGQPIRAFAPLSRGAQDYHHLANELDELWPPRRRTARYSSALPAHDSAA